VVSGVNPGPNLGSDVYLSGTVGAARVATTLGIPGVAVSCRRDPAAPAWETAARTALRAAEWLADGHSVAPGLPPLVNINVPSVAPRSVKATTVAGAHVVEQAVVEREATPGDEGRHLRLELRTSVPRSLEPGTDAWAFFAGDTALTVLDHPANGTASAPEGAAAELARRLARHLTDEVSRLGGS
jgi:5'-nucleotidase